MMAGFSAADKQALAEETPLCRLGRPEEVAAAAVFLAGDQAAFITRPGAGGERRAGGVNRPLQ